MSMVPKEMIEVIAQSIGIPGLSPGVALALTTDLEYRLREMMQEAVKCMRHSKRTILTVNDVDIALSLKNDEAWDRHRRCYWNETLNINCYRTWDPLQFRKAIGHKDLYYSQSMDLPPGFLCSLEKPLDIRTSITLTTKNWTSKMLLKHPYPRRH